MLLISHRGNIDSINPEMENRIEYIQKAINEGYDVEIDVWFKDGELYLGHDEPQYITDIYWLGDRNDKLWIHTKNFAALSYLIGRNLRLFYHEKEKHTIIHNSNQIWSHELNEADENSVIPLLSFESLKNYDGKTVYAICSDFVGMYKELEKR